MSPALWCGVFTLALAALVLGANVFIAAAERAGRAFRLSPFVVGVVLVGFGTSLPELVASLLAALEGASEIVIGNVLGSNITNVLLIMGIGGVLAGTFSIKTDLLTFDIPVVLGSAFILYLMVQDGAFTRGEGAICLLMLGIYIIASVRPDSGSAREEQVPDVRARDWLALTVSPLFIFIGARYTVQSVVALAGIAGIGADVIAMSAVALGTSLPEVVVAISAARRGQPDIVVGNIMGSNIFNVFAVMGIPSMTGVLTIPPDVIDYSIPVFLVVTLLLVFLTVDRRVTRAEGAFLLSFYLFFLGRLFAWL